MTRLERNVNIAAVVVPFAGLIAAAIIAWHHFLGPRDIAIFAVCYAITGLGITVGFHRLLTHRAFDTYRWLRLTFAVAGSLAVEGSVIDWVADHRKHHTFPDQEGDPHSPHVGHGAGVKGMARGLWHSHVGWLFSTHGQARSRRYARDLCEDPAMRAINRRFPLIALSGGSLVAGLSALLWGGLVRIFLVHHVTWSVNSVCHFFGGRRFDTEDKSTNVFWLSLPTLGESWHHNHHAFPRSAWHGLRWWEIDLSGLLIAALERLGLAWNVIRVSPERQLQKLGVRADST